MVLPTFALTGEIVSPMGGLYGPSFSTSTTTSTSVSAPPSPTTLSCSPASASVGSPFICKATVAGAKPSGLVDWSSDGTGRFSAHACRLSKGSCSVRYTPGSVASTVNITASYAGDGHNPPSVGSFGLAVVKKTPALTLACSPSSVMLGSPKVVKCTAHVRGYFPAGIVTWSQSGTGSFAFGSSACTLAKGSCSIKMTGATAGTITIQATYGGDQDNSGNAMSCRALVVDAPGSAASPSSKSAPPGGNCPTGTVAVITTSSTTTISTGMSIITATSTTTAAPAPSQALIVVTPDFPGSPGVVQSVSVFIDGQNVGSASSSNPSVSVVNPGSHTVSCSDVNGYLSPGAATFTISGGHEEIVQCIYVPTGSGVTTTTTTTTMTSTSSTAITTTSLITSTTATTSTSPILNGIPDPSIHNGTANISYPSDSAALVGYALSLINTDRQANGVAPLTLSAVPSGQQHADSMLYFGYFGHGDPQGYGPYQRYTMLGGSGPMGENIGFAACTDSPPNSTLLYPQPCSTNTVENGVAVLEWSMMNNDVQCCGNGHRANILNPIFTTVSIGIVYDSATSAVYFVEDFGTK